VVVSATVDVVDANSSLSSEFELEPVELLREVLIVLGAYGRDDSGDFEVFLRVLCENKFTVACHPKRGEYPNMEELKHTLCQWKSENSSEIVATTRP
jgi:hypothetical protein